MNRIHPLSVLLGAAFAGICFLTMSQSVVATNSIRIEYMPHPRDMVQIQEGVPYVVPQNRIFVLTGLGTTSFGWGAILFVNGVVAIQDYVGNSGAAVGSTIHSVPVGFSVPAGSTITVMGSFPTNPGLALGYLSGL